MCPQYKTSNFTVSYYRTWFDCYQISKQFTFLVEMSQKAKILITNIEFKIVV